MKKGLKHRIEAFFGFSRSEASGFIVLAILMLLILAANPVLEWLNNPGQRDFSEESHKLDSLTFQWDALTVITDTSSAKLQRFDPNTAGLDELLALGFESNLAHRLINYRQAGGSFQVKSDLLHLYGMDSAFYVDLYQYISLPENKVFAAREQKKYTPREQSKRVYPIHRPVEPFDLNLADTADLKQIRGIGAVLSARIVRFRDALGGFLRKEQLYEVYGLDSVVVKELSDRAFITDIFSPEQLNINTAGQAELSAHPYISGRLASAIVSYRFQHGKYSSVEEILKIESVARQNPEKILPYLTVSPP